MAENNGEGFCKHQIYGGCRIFSAIRKRHIPGLVKWKIGAYFTNIFTNIEGFIMLQYAVLWKFSMSMPKEDKQTKTLIL